MVRIETAYGEKCSNRKDVEKTSREICKNCPLMKGLYWTYSVCYLKEQ